MPASKKRPKAPRRRSSPVVRACAPPPSRWGHATRPIGTSHKMYTRRLLARSALAAKRGAYCHYSK